MVDIIIQKGLSWSDHFRWYAFEERPELWQLLEQDFGKKLGSGKGNRIKWFANLEAQQKFQ
jgi:hypothetical protein